MELRCVAERQVRLSWILRRELRLSDGLIKRIKYDEPFFVNGVARHTNYPVQVGDVVSVVFREDEPDFPAEEGELSVVYEDDALLAVDKPAGIMVHPSSQRNTGTLANRLLWYYRQTGQRCAVHVLTRLDRDTKGVVLFAKNAHMHDLLMQALEQGTVRKTYLAVVCGCPSEEEGIIDLPIDRSRPGSMLRCVREGGKRAVTAYRVLEKRGEHTLLRLQPLTGRTHQLRVHCSYMGFPILNDPQYGGGEGGQELVAKQLELLHPLTGEKLVLQSHFFPHFPEKG